MTDFMKHLNSMSEEKRSYALLTSPAHFAAAHQTDRLHKILTTFDFMQVKLETFTSQSLISDFEMTVDAELTSIRDAIQLSLYVIDNNPNLLAQQLLGRLQSSTYSQVQFLLNQARLWRGTDWLCPKFTSLTPPGYGMQSTFIQHLSQVNCVAITPDGNTIVSGDYDGIIIVWDAYTGDVVHKIKGHSSSVGCIAVFPDSKRMVSGGGDNTDLQIKVWDIDTGKMSQTMSLHHDAISSVAISSDGKHFITGSLDGNVVLWDVDRGDYVKWFDGHGAAIWSVDISSDNKWIAAGFGDGSLSIWKMDSGTRYHHLREHERTYIHDIAFVDNTQYLVTASEDGTLILWDYFEGKVIRRFDGESFGINSVAVFPPKSLMISACDDTKLTLWNLLNGERIRTFEGHFDNVKTVAISNDGNWAVSGGADYKLLSWQLNPRQHHEIQRAPRHKRSILGLEIVDNDGYAISESFDGGVFKWDLLKGDIVQKSTQSTSKFVRERSPTMPHGELNPPFESFGISSPFHVERYVIAHDKGTITASIIEKHVNQHQIVAAIWDLRTGTMINHLQLGGYHVHIHAISTDGEKCIATLNNTTCILCNFRTGQVHEAPEKFLDDTIKLVLSPVDLEG